MTTSITDARFMSLHATDLHLLSLSIDDDPELGWGVMPGYDQNISIPPHLEPPRMDADDILPSMMHPSYPYGRPSVVRHLARGGGLSDMREALGVAGSSSGNGADLTGGRGQGAGRGVGLPGKASKGVEKLFKTGQHARGIGGMGGMDDKWVEFGLDGILEKEIQKEAPPGMAGAKRPLPPPSPSLHPTVDPLHRSEHFRHAHERRVARAISPGQGGQGDPFDAPVPNETHGEAGQGQQGGR